MIRHVIAWAENRGSWWPACAGLLISCFYPAVQNRLPWLWLPAGLGLVMIAIRPVGTGLYRRQVMRECARLLDETRRGKS